MGIGCELVCVVIISLSSGADSASCMFWNRPNETLNTYSASTSNTIIGSPSQEDYLFFTPNASGLAVSWIIQFGICWGITVAAIVVLILKTSHFGWSLNRPNVCLALTAVGTFLTGAELVQDTVGAFVYKHSDDLSFFKATRVGVFVNVGWICLMWAFMVFILLWADIAVACGKKRVKCIKFSAVFVTVLNTIWFAGGLLISLSIYTVNRENMKNLNEIKVEKFGQYDALPDWFQNWTSAWGGGGGCLQLIHIVVLTLMCCLMRSAIQPIEHFPTKFVTITRRFTWWQMAFNVVLFLLFVFALISAAADITPGTSERSALIIVLYWTLCAMTVTWALRFPFIFAQAVDPKGISTTPRNMFGSCHKHLEGGGKEEI